MMMGVQSMEVAIMEFRDDKVAKNKEKAIHKDLE
jgi:hypothetical protein